MRQDRRLYSFSLDRIPGKSLDPRSERDSWAARSMPRGFVGWHGGQGPKMGFTLMELVICLSLMGILLAFSIPTGMSFYQHTQQKAIQLALQSAVRHARLHAMINNAVCVLAPSDASQDWSLGIGLYKLEDFQQTPRQKPFSVWSWSKRQTQVVWRGFQSQHALYFMPDVAHNAVNGSFLVNVAQQPPIKLVVSRFGFIHQ